MSSQFRAGALIRGGAIGTCLRAWHQAGGKPHCWAHARKVLAELFPESRHNSREAVIRVTQTARLAGKWMQEHPDSTCPECLIPDVRRLIREGTRE